MTGCRFVGLEIVEVPEVLRGLLLNAGALALLTLSGCQQQPAAPSADAAKGTVTLEINDGNQKESFQVTDVADGSTLESVMRDFTQIPVVVQGSGTTAFVESIGDTATSQSEGWTFQVDGKFANQGVGKTILHPPTTVTWSYGDWDGDAQP